MAPTIPKGTKMAAKIQWRRFPDMIAKSIWKMAKNTIHRLALFIMHTSASVKVPLSELGTFKYSLATFISIIVNQKNDQSTKRERECLHDRE